MISKKSELRQLLMSHGLSVRESNETSDLLERECPWFGEGDEVSRDIGAQLIGDVLPKQVASLIDSSSLVDWHNAAARGEHDFFVAAANSAYLSLVEAVRAFGIEDGLGNGDFWVMEDSFSGQCATVMAFKKPPLPDGLAGALETWLHTHPIMKGIQVVDREGEVLFKRGATAD
jgi:hypothetical protein